MNGNMRDERGISIYRGVSEGTVVVLVLVVVVDVDVDVWVCAN